MLFNKDKDSQLFLQRLTKLTPEEFIALGKILDVKMSVVNAETGEYTVRDAEEIIDDMVVAFRHFKHKERQLILKAMTVHKPTKEIVEDVQNGPLS
jgi:hypothetical protein